MADRPILFSAAMTRALLAGNKTETRRLAWGGDCGLCHGSGRVHKTGTPSESHVGTCPSCGGGGQSPTPWQKVQPGDRLWVRESWRVTSNRDTIKPRDLEPRKMTVMFVAGGSIANDVHGKWVADDWPATVPDVPAWAGKNRPGIFLPRWASRLTLIVTGVRVEPLQAITSAGAIAEGITGSGRHWSAGDLACGTDPVACFSALWWALHGIASWGENPSVVVTSFDVIRLNIDDVSSELHPPITRPSSEIGVA